MNDTIKRKMKRTYGLISHVKENRTEHKVMLMQCLCDLEDIYDDIFADREKLSDTIDKPMS
jgi:hypothetical protein